MARTLTMTFFILTLFSLPSQGQTDFRVMSYNVENLFDTVFISNVATNANQSLERAAIYTPGVGRAIYGGIQARF